MLDFEIYTPWLPGPIKRQLISQVDWSKVPMYWVANRLALIPRYNAAIDAPYLDKHMLAVHNLVFYCGGNLTERREAIGHDMAEIWVGDIVSPIKNMLPAAAISSYRQTEYYILNGVCPAVNWSNPSPLVKLCDAAIRDTERGFEDLGDVPCQEAKTILADTLGTTRATIDRMAQHAYTGANNSSWLDGVGRLFEERT